MNLNKIFLISLLLIAVLSLTAVSASEDIGANLTSVDTEAVEEVVAVDDSADEAQSVEDENVLEDGAGEVLSDKEDPVMYVDFSESVVMGDDESDYIYVMFDYDVTGDLSFFVDGKLNDTYKLSEESSHYFYLSNLDVGTHSFEVKYSGDENYLEASIKDKFNVFPYEVYINTLVYYGASESFEVEIYGATGDVVAIIDNKRYSAPLIRGTAFIDLPSLSIGKHNARIEYAGDKKFVPFSVDVELDVQSFIVGPGEVAFNENGEIYLELPSNAKGNLLVTVDGKEFKNVPLVNGHASVSLSSLNEFNTGYDVTAEYTGEDYKVMNEYFMYYRDLPKITVPSELIEGKEYTITFEVPSKYSGNLNVSIRYDGHSDKYSAEVVNGKASVTFKANHSADVLFDYDSGSDYSFLNLGDPYMIFVGPDPQMSVNVDSKPGSDPVFTVNVASDAGGAFTVLINGKEYTTSYFTGSKSLKIDGLADGTYTAAVIYSGDYKYPSVTKEVTFTKSTPKPAVVKKVTKITLTLKKVTVKKSAKKLVLTATLKINGKVAKNKKLTFKFNKKTFKAKTNKKGIAKVTVKKSVLKKLKVGKKVKYQVSYGKKTVSKTVKVKK